MEKKKKEVDLSHLTNESARIIANIMEGMRLSLELDDVLMCLSQADLIKYQSSQGFTTRFGVRFSKNTIIHVIDMVINGMANRIDELEKQLNGKAE